MTLRRCRHYPLRSMTDKESNTERGEFMRKTLTKIGLLSVMAMVMAVGAQAQSLASRIKINIPFDFNVADKKLPAGVYSVSRSLLSSDDTVLAITGLNKSASAFPLTNSTWSTEPKRHATLVF